MKVKGNKREKEDWAEEEEQTSEKKGNENGALPALQCCANTIN